MINKDNDEKYLVATALQHERTLAAKVADYIIANGLATATRDHRHAHIDAIKKEAAEKIRVIERERDAFVSRLNNILDGVDYARRLEREEREERETQHLDD